MTVEVETLIIGAGVIGSATAMHLGRLGMSGIRVVDFDLEGSLSSSELNAGAVRATWAQPVNIRMSQVSIDYFAAHAAEVGYRPCGYLWLHTPAKMPAALKSRERQLAMGWGVEAWDVAELRRRKPFIDKTDDLAGALFAPRDGLVNPNRLKNHFRDQAKAAGAAFDDRVMVRRAEYENRRIVVSGERFSPALGADEKRGALTETGSTALPTEPVKYRANRVINCAGAWAANVAKALGYACPSFPVRRQVAVFDCRDVDLTEHGMTIDPSGVYFHPEATNGLAGFAVPGEAHGYNFEYDGETFFNDVLWPALYERSTKFERLKHLTGWSGLYECSPDDSAIIGAVENGEAGAHGNVFEAHSFSGHGVMHAYAAGLALAERIVSGRYETVDAQELSANRFETGRFVREGLVI